MFRAINIGIAIGTMPTTLFSIQFNWFEQSRTAMLLPITSHSNYQTFNSLRKMYYIQDDHYLTMKVCLFISLFGCI